MITCLAKFWIRESDSEEKKRRVYGTLGAVVGIFLNICLFVGKYLAGFLSGSIAIMADAFNNLSDAGSSFISLIGFVFSGKSLIWIIRLDMEGSNIWQGSVFPF